MTIFWVGLAIAVLVGLTLRDLNRSGLLRRERPARLPQEHGARRPDDISRASQPISFHEAAGSITTGGGLGLNAGQRAGAADDLARSIAAARPVSPLPFAREREIISGIALRNPVTLYLPAPRDALDETAALLPEIFETLALSPYLVDISADPGLANGLPLTDDGPVLPALYLGGVFYGDTAKVLEGLHTGDLVKALDRARLDYDSAAAAQLAGSA